MLADSLNKAGKDLANQLNNKVKETTEVQCPECSTILQMPQTPTFKCSECDTHLLKPTAQDKFVYYSSTTATAVNKQVNAALNPPAVVEMISAKIKVPDGSKGGDQIMVQLMNPTPVNYTVVIPKDLKAGDEFEFRVKKNIEQTGVVKRVIAKRVREVQTAQPVGEVAYKI